MSYVRCYFGYMEYNLITLIKKVNTQYNLLFRDNCFLLKIIEASFIILNEALSLFIIYSMSENIFEFYELDTYVKYLILIICFFVIHYLVGIVLIYYNNLKGRDSDGKALTGDFLISFFLIIVSLFFIILFYRETIKTFAMSFIIADLASYLLNIKLLAMFLIKGRKSKGSNCGNNFFIILTTAIVIVFMIILNLFIGVVVVDGVNPSSFSSCPGVFDLFYYTIVTFTTIGFGDIVPLTVGAKVMAVFISVSSILCLSVFLGSIYSIRNK